MLYPLRAVVVFSAVAFGCNVAAAAVPSGAEPDAPLAVRDDARSREWLALTLRLYGEAKAGVNTICDKTDGQKFKALKPIVFGQTHVKLLRCERMAKLLSIWGEPAGADFTLRADELRAPFQRAVKAYAALPGSSEKTNKELQLLQREADRRVSVLPKIKQLGDKGEWEAAGVVLYETLDAMELFAVWFDSEARKPIFSRFFSSQSRVDTNLEELWRKRLTQTLTESREKQLPDFGRMLAEAQTAAAALRSAAKAEAGGEQRDGPAALAYFGQRWRAVELAALHCEAIDWTLGAPESGKTLAQLRDEHAKFAKEIGPALLKIIESDVARAGAGEVASLYAGYLDALPPLATLQDDDALALAAAPMLEQLAKKSEAVAAEAAAYRAATGDWLVWRQRLAAASARAHGGKETLLRKAYLDVARLTVDDRQLLVAANAVDTANAGLLFSAPEVLRAVAEKMNGQAVQVERLAGASTARKMSFSRYGDRMYAQAALPAAYSQAVAALEQGLLAGPKAPPLSFEAALALASARRGDLLAAGGKIKNMYLESPLTRFIGLPPGGQAIIPLGVLPKEALGNMTNLRSAAMRFDIQPAWLHQTHFFLLAE